MIFRILTYFRKILLEYHYMKKIHICRRATQKAFLILLAARRRHSRTSFAHMYIRVLDRTTYVYNSPENALTISRATWNGDVWWGTSVRVRPDPALERPTIEAACPW